MLTNTGPIAAGANKLICAVVTVPTINSGNATPGTTNFTFRAQSPVTPASSDTIVDAVTVSAAHNITLAPNGSQQTFPGNTVTYVHTLKNSGNSSENVTFTTGFLSDSQSTAGWTSQAYVDTNANGVYDAGTDTLISTATTLAVAANTSQTLFVRVFAPGQATTGSAADVTTLTATYNGGTQTTSITDTTSVTNGLLLSKAQVAGTCAAGLAAGPFSTAAISAGANTAPGKCVVVSDHRDQYDEWLDHQRDHQRHRPLKHNASCHELLRPDRNSRSDSGWHGDDGRLDGHSDRNTGQPCIRRDLQSHLLREDQPIE